MHVQLLLLMAVHQSPLKGRERPSSGASAAALGVNGLLKSETLARVSVSGLALTTPLRKLPEPMMLKQEGSVARRQRSISQMRLLWLLKSTVLSLPL
jgi:hypothetical protein